MQLIDRYLFRELLGPAVVATAALSGVAILSQSLSALDVIVDERQSVFIFAKIILLAMPQLEVLILPVAVLVGALVSLNRLHTEQEIVICFAGGMSRWRVMAPALTLAALATVTSLVLTLWIQPLCYRELRRTLSDVRTDISGALIRPGAFSHPAPGVTVFAQSMDDDGAIHNLFIDRATPSGRDSTVMAREGRIERRGGAPMLVLRHGANQEFSKTGVLNYLSFDQYVLDLRPLAPPNRAIIYKLSDRYLHELFFPDLRGAWEQTNAGKLLAEGNARIADPLYNLTFMALALAGVIGGSFSRMGYGQRIAVAACAALMSRVLGLVIEGASGATPALNVVQYVIPLGVAAAAIAALYLRRESPRPLALAAGATA
jgi:lipopolysaccharide export system permease protein